MIPLQVSLKKMGCDLFSIIPLTQGKALIGNISKMIPMAAMERIKIDRNRITARSIEKGPVWIYSKVPPKKVLVDQQETANYVYNHDLLKLDLSNDGCDILVEF